jgi:hypothetical protein
MGSYGTAAVRFLAVNGNVAPVAEAHVEAAPRTYSNRLLRDSRNGHTVYASYVPSLL